MTLVCSELGQGTTSFSVQCCFGVMYVEWYGICDYVVFSVVHIYVLSMVVSMCFKFVLICALFMVLGCQLIITIYI